MDKCEQKSGKVDFFLEKKWIKSGFWGNFFCWGCLKNIKSIPYTFYIFQTTIKKKVEKSGKSGKSGFFFKKSGKKWKSGKSGKSEWLDTLRVCVCMCV